MEKASILGKKFQDRVKYLLKKLDFNDVEGGDTFYIGESQIDACGGHEKTLLIFECYYSGVKRQKSQRDKIKEFKGIIQLIRKDINKDQKYKKYNKIKFIFITKNIKLPKENYKFAEQTPTIEIWNDEILEYYADLYSKIGKYARFQLLGDLGIKPEKASIVNIPAFQIEHFNKYKIYIFYINPHKLLECSYTARRGFGKEIHYQRLIRNDKIKKITNFINNKGLFPNNIIISINEDEEFKEIEKKEIFRKYSDYQEYFPKWLKFGFLKFPSNYRSCWIIDGQHRLYGYSFTNVDSKVPVAAFRKLTDEKQANFFLTINSEQTPVDADLTWDLQGILRPNSREGIISNSVKILNTLVPFRGNIFIPAEGRKKTGQFKMAGLCITVKKLKLTERVSRNMRGRFNNPFFSDNADSVQKKLSKSIAEFFSFLNKNINEKALKNFIYKSDGALNTMFGLYEKILASTNKSPENKLLKEKKYINILDNYLRENYPDEQDYIELINRTNSEGGRSDLVEEFIERINYAIENKNDILVRDPNKRRIGDEFQKLERDLSKIIKIRLNEKFKSQDKKSETIGKDIVKRVKSRMRPGDDFYDRLGLGECRTIIEKNWVLFRDIFIGFKEGFHSRDEFFVFLQLTGRLKASLASHNLLPGSDMRYAIPLLGHFKTCIYRYYNRVIK